MFHRIESARARLRKGVSHIFFLTLVANNFIYESHCGPWIANLMSGRINR